MTSLVSAAALLSVFALGAAGGEPRPLPFISNDYPRALAQARQRGLPLFIEAWAPWCHTCRSMRAFVLSDPALASQAGRFVWLDLDTDVTANEPVLAKHQADALPTFLVVDPKDESVVLRWVGSFTVAQAEAFLQEAHDKARREVPATPADAALDRADRLYGARNYAEAATAYQQALAAAPSDWPRHPRATEALVFCLQQTGAHARAAALAREALPRLAGTPSLLIVGAAGLDSAAERSASEPGRGVEIAMLEAALRHALADPALRAAADDRSGAFLSLFGARKALADAEGARRVAEEWLAFLDAEAAQASSPEQRAVFDSHRMTVYLELGRAADAVTMLEATERALPGDYNAPNRLARALAALARWDEALAASQRAERLSEGRARLRVLTTRAELLQQRGDLPASARAYDEAIAYAEALPEAERPQRPLARLRQQREALAAAASP